MPPGHLASFPTMLVRSFVGRLPFPGEQAAQFCVASSRVRSWALSGARGAHAFTVFPLCVAFLAVASWPQLAGLVGHSLSLSRPLACLQPSQLTRPARRSDKLRVVCKSGHGGRVPNVFTEDCDAAATGTMLYASHPTQTDMSALRTNVSTGMHEQSGILI